VIPPASQGAGTGPIAGPVGTGAAEPGPGRRRPGIRWTVAAGLAGAAASTLATALAAAVAGRQADLALQPVELALRVGLLLGAPCVGAVLAAMVGLRLPLQSHPLQALVSVLLEPVLGCVVMSNAVHVYVSQADKGELVMGAGIDAHNSYTQRGSFEVIEHMDIGDGRMLVMGMAELLEPEGTILISTPRNPGDRKQARNHVHEWSDEELGAVFHEAGLRVRERYGTFGDVDSLRRAAKADPAALQVYDRLRPYYSDEVLACFLAPLYPEACKNSIWVLEHKE